MSISWDEYCGLFEQRAAVSGDLAAAEAAANAEHAADARRQQQRITSAEAELASLRERSSRLQVHVRDLTRALGVTLPAEVEERIPAERLGDAIASVEYDLEQLRRSRESLLSQQAAAAAPAPRQATLVTAAPAPVAAAPEANERPGAPMIAIVGIAALVVIALGVVVAVSM